MSTAASDREAREEARSIASASASTSASASASARTFPVPSTTIEENFSEELITSSSAAASTAASDRELIFPLLLPRTVFAICSRSSTILLRAFLFKVCFLFETAALFVVCFGAALEVDFTFETAELVEVVK